MCTGWVSPLPSHPSPARYTSPSGTLTLPSSIFLLDGEEKAWHWRRFHPVDLGSPGLPIHLEQHPVLSSPRSLLPRRLWQPRQVTAFATGFSPHQPSCGPFTTRAVEDSTAGQSAVRTPGRGGSVQGSKTPHLSQPLTPQSAFLPS